MHRIDRYRYVLPLVILSIVGCDSFKKESKLPQEAELDQTTAQAMNRHSTSLAVRGTIGEATWTQGLGMMKVRGYGLVVGLGQTGSRNCPEKIRRRVAADIQKHYRLGDSRLGLGDLTVDKLFNNPDTAVVLVEGAIPPAALRASRFDLTVKTIPGTETTSLEGGRLYTCDLRLYQDVGAGMVQEGKVLAKGEGPILINTASPDANSALPPSTLIGRIVNGGYNQEDRRIRLRLTSPSYAMAIRIQDRINDRFGMGQKLASAETPDQVSLKIPARYINQELDFIDLARHIYLNSEAGFAERRAQELAQEILDPLTPADDIGLAWEGLGKSIRPIIRNLYSDPRSHVNYYAARTGLRLGDPLSVQVLTQHATDSDSEYQLASIRELGWARDIPKAADVLRKIIESELPAPARIQAYEGLIQQNDPEIRSTELGNQFVLDQIENTAGQPIVYAKTDRQCRLALLGRIQCKTPLFYHHSRGIITMNAPEDAQTIAIVRQTPTGLVSPTVAGPLDLYELIVLLGTKAGEDKTGQVTGLGLSYSQVIEVVSKLCENGSLEAEFQMEQPQLRPSPKTEPEGRPESEL